MKFLDHLEEWLIAFLMGAATLIIFVAVVHRYAAGMPIPGLQDTLLEIDLSWAQELCIYMFVWMAKFGAAYGVRTGIHVGVDVMINRLPREHAQGATSCSGCSPARSSPASSARSAPRSSGTSRIPTGVARPRDSEVDRLPVHSARLLPDVLPLPAGGLVVRAHRRVAAPRLAHVEGIEARAPDINRRAAPDNSALRRDVRLNGGLKSSTLRRHPRPRQTRRAGRRCFRRC